MADRKTSVTIQLSSRTMDVMTGEAKRLGIAFSECARRGLDDYADSIEKARGAKQVVVLDRASGQILNGR